MDDDIFATDSCEEQEFVVMIFSLLTAVRNNKSFGGAIFYWEFRGTKVLVLIFLLLEVQRTKVLVVRFLSLKVQRNKRFGADIFTTRG